jgi:hypothetical protein
MVKEYLLAAKYLSEFTFEFGLISRGWEVFAREFRRIAGTCFTPKACIFNRAGKARNILITA